MTVTYEGDLSEDLIEEFAVNAYDIVRSLDTTSQVTVLSYSLGNGPAVYLASREDADIDRLVLLAPYYSGYDLYNSVLNISFADPPGPARLFLGLRHSSPGPIQSGRLRGRGGEPVFRTCGSRAGRNGWRNNCATWSVSHNYQPK